MERKNPIIRDTQGLVIDLNKTFLIEKTSAQMGGKCENTLFCKSC